MFVDVCKVVVCVNEEYVFLYGIGGILYFCFFLIGVGDIIGVKLVEEYIFIIFVMLVGNYFKGGLVLINFLIQDEYDCAVLNGIGAVKVGGNYAVSFLLGKLVKLRYFLDVIYLDLLIYIKIEEVGLVNFFGIIVDNEFVILLSFFILLFIIKYFLFYLVEYCLGLIFIEGDVLIDNFDCFVEVGVCGIAVVIFLIGGIQYGDDFYVFYSEIEVGFVICKLYDELIGIQFGDIEVLEGWIVKVD